MKLFTILLLSFLHFCTIAAPPAYDEFCEKIRPGHPRMFLTRDTIPLFREHARMKCRQLLKTTKERIDKLPDKPELTLKKEIAEIKDDKLIFKKHLNDQDAAIYAVETSGGIEALECAILYIVTGETQYLEKAKAYLELLTEFVAWSDRYRILPEWYNNTRLAGFIAYDWLYNELSPQEREAFIVPMLKHVEHMQKPGYLRNNGGADSGNYGEPGLQYFAGLAAFGDGMEEQLADKLLRNGYNLNVAMMELRDKVSAGSGLLVSLCGNYSFGEYPWASYNFLYTLKSAAGIDGAELWSQPQNYADWFFWAAIPHREATDGFLDFGWGDAYHKSNELSCRMMYTHLAQIINLYKDSAPECVERAYNVIAMIPQAQRRLLGLRKYPFLPFILTSFDWNDDKTVTMPECNAIAAYFPSFGVMSVRSGTTENDTYASIKAGAEFTRHQHYDENSFIIYKKGFQALDSGTRCSAPHHKLYYPQSIAHNTILIRTENEPLPNYWYPGNAPEINGQFFNDGGQNRMAAADSLGFSMSEYHAATGGDATQCYSSGKCREAIRQFVYVVPDYFVIYDRVTSVKPEQRKSFILHTQNKPEEITPGIWRSQAGDGALMINFLLPQNITVDIIGGPGREFWTNNRNWSIPGYENVPAENNWFGRYRMELSPRDDAQKTRFLSVLQTADKETREMIKVKKLYEPEFDGVTFTTREGLECAVKFKRDGQPGGHIRITKNQHTLVDSPLP